MPTWTMPNTGRSMVTGESLKRATFEKVDLTRRCICGCYLGSHYFTYVPGGPMCSTCDTCVGFRATEKHQGTA
jgi:hypothetical protein